MNFRVGDGVAVAVLGDTFFLYWKAPATEDRVRWTIEQRKQLLRSDSFVVADVVMSSSTPPNARARELIVSDFSSLVPQMRRVIFAPIGNALWQSLVKTIVKAAMLVVKLTDRLSVCAGEDELIGQLRAEASPATASDAELREALRSLRVALETRSEATG